METMNTDTPETDGEWNRLACQDHPEFERNLSDFARKLERERDEIRAQLREEQRLHVQTLNERDEARQWESQALVARIQRDQFSETLGEIREILCAALPNENQLTSFMAVKLVRDRDEAREIASWWRDNWKQGRTVSMIASIKLPWENAKSAFTGGERNENE